MLWKELLIPRIPVFHRPLGLSITLVLVGLLAWGTIDFAIPAFREVCVSGYGVAPSGSARDSFHVYLRIVGTGISLVVALEVASDAAAGITSELAKDTWISLIATPPTGAEIVRAKMLGDVWGTRHTVAVLVMLGLAGVWPGRCIRSVLRWRWPSWRFAWFAAALETWISLRAGATQGALARDMACLLIVNGGSMLGSTPLNRDEEVTP
jgi:hypothetical protein